MALRLNGGRPRGVPLPRVTVSLEGEELGSVELTNEFRDYVFPIPRRDRLEPCGTAGWRANSHSKLDMDSAGRFSAGPDTRALGVMIDRAEIR